MDWVWSLLMAVRAALPADDDRWAVRLAVLDQAREAAFAQGSPRRLDAVYVRGSRARAVDAATISSYALRGGRVVGAELRILLCRVVYTTRDRVRLDVVDRLQPATVMWEDGTSVALPRDEPSRRIITVDRTRDGWRIAGAREVSPRR